MPLCRTLLLAALAAAAAAQPLPPLPPLPSLASPRLAPRVADAVEAASGGADDRSWVPLNGTALGGGGAPGVDGREVADITTADACRAACAAAPACYGATWTVDLDFMACQLWEAAAATGGKGGGGGGCPPLVLAAAPLALSFLFPGTYTAAVAGCGGGGGGVGATSASPAPPAAAAFCARFPRLCPSPTGRRRRRALLARALAATPVQDAGAAGWGLAVDARRAAATVHGVAVALPWAGGGGGVVGVGAGPNATLSRLEYLGTVANVATAKACEGYCQQMRAPGVDNGGDGGSVVPVTPFEDSPFGEAPFSRLAVARGPLPSLCLASSWYDLAAATGVADGRHGHVCDLFGPFPGAGDTVLVAAPSRAGPAATTSVRAGRWSAVVGWAWGAEQEGG